MWADSTPVCHVAAMLFCTGLRAGLSLRRLRVLRGSAVTLYLVIEEPLESGHSVDATASYQGTASAPAVAVRKLSQEIGLAIARGRGRRRQAGKTQQ